MNRDALWENLKDAIGDQLPTVKAWLHVMHPSMELYEISRRPIDWAIIVARLLPEGFDLSKTQEDEVYQRTATLHDLMDYVQQVNDEVTRADGS